MLYASDFRKMARESLNAKWGVAILSWFIATLLGAAITGGGSSIFSSFSNDSTRNSVRDILNSGYGSLVLPFFISIWSFIVIWGIVIFIIGGPITLGYAKFNLNIIHRENPEFSNIFSQFERFGAGFLMQLLRVIYIFLWTLLLIIPGIIATFSYAMTPFAMLDHPELSANQAIGYSKEIMRGNKWRLFCLDISFIGWAFLCLFSCGIGYLWLGPYMEAAHAAFYREIKR